MEMMRDQIVKLGLILEELSNFDDMLLEMCIMSEMEGEFGMGANDMISAINEFIQYSKTFGRS